MPAQTTKAPNSSSPKVVSHYFDDDFIGSVRERLLERLELLDNNNSEVPFKVEHEKNDPSQQQQLPYDAEDVHRLRSDDDWFIRRCLKWEPTSLEQAVETVHQSLLWRRQIQINTWSPDTFPSEFYQVAACFSYLPDREGNNVMILRLRFNRKDPHGHAEMERLARHYFIYQLEQMVAAHPNTGFGLIFDCHKASLSNVDLDMARFIINTLSSHYSGAIAYVCIYELPWLFNQIWKLVRSWLDEDARKIVRFASLSSIADMIDHAHLPDYMGGTGGKDYRHVPKGVPSVEELAQTRLGLTNRKEVAKLSEHFQKLIQQA